MTRTEVIEACRALRARALLGDPLIYYVRVNFHPARWWIVVLDAPFTKLNVAPARMGCRHARKPPLSLIVQLGALPALRYGEPALLVRNHFGQLTITTPAQWEKTAYRG